MLNVMLERDDFINRIHQLFQQWRKGRFDPALVDWCATAPLLQSVLVSLSSTSATMPTATELVELALAWTVEMLRPAVDAPPTSKAVRDFTILATYYGQGAAAKAVYQALAGTESTFRTNWSTAATAAAADLLYQHWQATLETGIGQSWQRYALIHALPPAQQAVLQLLAVSTTPWSIGWLAQWPSDAAADLTAAPRPNTPLAATLTTSRITLEQLPVAATIAWLVQVGWLSPVDTTTAAASVALTPALRTQVCNTLAPEERQSGHRLAAHCAFLAQEPLTAAWHWLQAGEEAAAIQLLLAQGQQLLPLDEFGDDMPEAASLSAEALETFAQLLDQVPSQAADASDWGRLKRLRGRVAEWQARQPQGAVERAQLIQRTRTEYQEALHFLPPGLERAMVHYQLAELSFALDSSLADQHLRHCIEQLTGLTVQPTTQPLLVRASIKRAWLTIQQRPDFTAAEANLKHARLLLDTLADRSPTLWGDWYNAWGTLCFCKGEFSKGVDALAQGIALLREQPNQVRLCMMLHNQGLEFSTQPSGDQQIALHYLQQSLAIALRLNHGQMQMLCYKAIGGCYFHLAQYAEAIRYYEQAYTLIPTESDFKVHLCYDLAEAYIMQAHDRQTTDRQTTDRQTTDRQLAPAAAITYFRQGFTLAQQMALPELIGAYHELAAQSPWIWIEPYKPRMAVAIRLLLTQGQLRSQAYAQAANINEKTALKDLQSWVAQKILYQSGKARATTYTFTLDNQHKSL